MPASTWTASSSARSPPPASRGRSCSSPPTQDSGASRTSPGSGATWGTRYAVDFAGAAHLAFTDLVFLVPQLAGTSEAAAQARLQPLVGTIDPTVAYAAERAHVLAFFDRG